MSDKEKKHDYIVKLAIYFSNIIKNVGIMIFLLVYSLSPSENILGGYRLQFKVIYFGIGLLMLLGLYVIIFRNHFFRVIVM